MIRRPPRSTQSRSSAASDVYKRQGRSGGGQRARSRRRGQRRRSPSIAAGRGRGAYPFRKTTAPVTQGLSRGPAPGGKSGAFRGGAEAETPDRPNEPDRRNERAENRGQCRTRAKAARSSRGQ